MTKTKHVYKLSRSDVFENIATQHALRERPIKVVTTGIRLMKNGLRIVVSNEERSALLEYLSQSDPHLHSRLVSDPVPDSKLYYMHI